MDSRSSTIIGVFSDVRDARRAVEDLRIEGFGSLVRFVENDQPDDLNLEIATHPDPDRRGGLSGFFSRLFGFEDEEESDRNLGNWKMNEELEKQFSDLYQRGYSLVVVEHCEEPQVCRDILVQAGAVVEEKGATLYQEERERIRRLDEEDIGLFREGDDRRRSSSDYQAGI